MKSNLQVPRLGDYSESELNSARAWPAVDRYLGLLERARSNLSLDEPSQLRIRRHQAWTECALALFHKRSTDKAVCLYWSESAETTICEAAKVCDFSKLGISIFALGKLGASELNLSSDVDLIFVTDNDRSDILVEQQTRAAKAFIKLLSDNSEWGFCHRVDVSIRPGGAQSPLIPTISNFENHYGYQGEVWERLALIRMRAIPLLAGVEVEREAEIEKFATNFSFRRHLDYSVLDELRLLLSRIRKEHHTPSDGTWNLKLQAGCIRDLELFVHALLCIHGGRRVDLRTRQTDDAISKLAKEGLVSDTDSEFLKSAYWTFRGIENRLQAENDEQTYRVTNVNDIQIIQELAARVRGLSESSFPNIKTSEMPCVESLVAQGFNREIAIDAMEGLQSARALSKKSERDERERTTFLSDFVNELASSSGDRNLGLGLLVDFVKATRAKATFFSLLNREPMLRKQLVRLFSESPWAGSILSSRPELLDSLLLRQDANVAKEFDAHGDMAQALESLAERRLTGELVAILHFLETRDLDSCTANLTTLADQISADLMYLVAKETGCAPLGIIALGKWGGRELGVRSDLDFIFCIASEPNAEQQRLARRFLNRMTEAHRGGSLYAVDMRLRPSGHAGPVLVQEKDLLLHLQTKAEAWERQSWLRARSVPGLPYSLSTEIQKEILKRGLNSSEEIQLQEIATKLFKPIPPKGKRTLVDLKLCQGGLAAIEFAAQISILRDGPVSSSTIGTISPTGLETSTRSMLQFLEEHAVANQNEWRGLGSRLREVHSWLRSLEQAARVTGDSTGSILHLESTEFARLAQLFKSEQQKASQNGETLENELLAILVESADCLNRLGR